MSTILSRLLGLLLLLSLVACSDNQAITPTLPPTIKSVGNLPLPGGVSHLDFTVEDLKKVSSLSSSLNLTGVEVSAYSVTQTTTEILKFYQTELKNRGWSPDEKRSQSNLLYFSKNSLVSAIIALPINSPSAADTLSNVIPSFRGKFKAGDNLLILTQGPQTAFATG